MKRDARISALLNVLIFGLGYIYNGKRVLFGCLLMLTEITGILWYLLNPQYFKIENFFAPLNMISFLAFVVAMGYDAYEEAKQMK